MFKSIWILWMLAVMSTAEPTKDLSKRAFPYYDQVRDVANWVLTRPSGGTQRALTSGAFVSGLVGSVIFTEHICNNCVGKHEDPDNDCRNSALTLMATTFIAVAAGHSLLQSNGAAAEVVSVMILAAPLVMLTTLNCYS